MKATCGSRHGFGRPDRRVSQPRGPTARFHLQEQPVVERAPEPALQQLEIAGEEFCGWPVVRDEHVSPSYVRDLFVGRNTLVPR